MALKQGDKIGILGGGQLAQLLINAANKLGLKTLVFDPNEDSPAFNIATEFICEPFSNQKALESFSKKSDIVTYEFENIPLATIDIITPHCKVSPNREALKIGQNRLLEKAFINQLGINTARYSQISSKKELLEFCKLTASKSIIKTTTSGYDGKGQVVIEPGKINTAAIDIIGNTQCIVEEFQEFHSEASIIASRGESGSVLTYDSGANLHKDGILIKTTVPSKLPKELEIEMALIAGKILNKLDYIGVMGIEFFVTSQGLILNEFAPRVHNSGHWTLDGCLINQFEQHIRAISGWPLGSTKRHSNIVMTNIIGEKITTDIKDNQSIYSYGKKEIRAGRKMGHINTIYE